MSRALPDIEEIAHREATITARQLDLVLMNWHYDHFREEDVERRARNFRSAVDGITPIRSRWDNYWGAHVLMAMARRIDEDLQDVPADLRHRLGRERQDPSSIARLPSLWADLLIVRTRDHHESGDLFILALSVSEWCGVKQSSPLKSVALTEPYWEILFELHDRAIRALRARYMRGTSTSW